jgi:foldase protein PrsA
VPAGLLIVAAILSGCGGGDEESSEDRPELPAGIVARVGEANITKAEADHWTEAARAQDPKCRQGGGCREQAMQFLVSGHWLVVHARRTGVRVTSREIDELFEKQKRQAFGSDREYRRWLRSSGRTEVDLHVQIKYSILTNKIQASLDTSGGKKNDQQRLDAFVARFRRTYKRQTICRRAFAPKGQCGTIIDGSPNSD